MINIEPPRLRRMLFIAKSAREQFYKKSKCIKIIWWQTGNMA
jgi:hypothetical protein